MDSLYSWPTSDSTHIRTGRHCVFNMHVHLVFVTKYRHNVFTKNILAHMQVIFSSVCRDFESELIEFDGEPDHVHLLIIYPPKIAVSKMVNSLKGVSSRMLRKQFPIIEEYAASCGGATLDVIQQYIQAQATPA